MSTDGGQTWRTPPVTTCLGQQALFRAANAEGTGPAPLTDYDTRVSDGAVLADVSITYTWDGGAGSGRFYSRSWDAPGQYTVTLTADDVGWSLADDPTAMTGVGHYVIGGGVEGPNDIRYKCGPPTYTYHAAGEQPGGTTYQWSIVEGGDKAHIHGDADQASVQVVADAPSADNGVRLQVKYSRGGQDCYADKRFTVLAPNHSTSSRQIGGFTHGFAGGVWWMERLVYYTIRDQRGNPIPGAWCDESFSQESGPHCALIEQRDGAADGNGVIVDWLYWQQPYPMGWIKSDLPALSNDNRGLLAADRGFPEQLAYVHTATLHLRDAG